MMHGADDADALEGALEAGEPDTPLWLTLLGGALLVIGLLVTVALGASDGESKGGTADAPGAARPVAE